MPHHHRKLIRQIILHYTGFVRPNEACSFFAHHFHLTVIFPGNSNLQRGILLNLIKEVESRTFLATNAI